MFRPRNGNSGVSFNNTLLYFGLCLFVFLIVHTTAKQLNFEYTKLIQQTRVGKTDSSAHTDDSNVKKMYLSVHKLST